MIGIYRIRNSVNQKIYIGSSKDIEERWYNHKRALRAGRHHSILLQRSWDKHGEESFVFEIVELIQDENQLLILEQTYLDKLNPKLNVGKNSSGGDNLTKHPLRDQIIEKMSIASKKRGKICGDYARKHYQGSGNPNYGNKWSDAQKDTASKRLKIYYENHDGYLLNKTFEEIHGVETALKLRKNISDRAKKRIGKKNPFYGKRHSEEMKNKVSKANKGRKPPNTKWVEINGILYHGLNEASKALSIKIPTIHWRINSKNKKFSNYKYVE